MSKPYKISVNQSNSFDFTDSDLSKLDAVSIENNHFHILKDNEPYQAEVISSDFNSRKYSVKVNGNTYDVAIANELDLLIDMNSKLKDFIKILDDYGKASCV